MNCGGKWLLGFIVGFIFILVAVSFGKVYTKVKIEAPFQVCIDDGDCMSWEMDTPASRTSATHGEMTQIFHLATGCHCGVI